MIERSQYSIVKDALNVVQKRGREAVWVAGSQFGAPLPDSRFNYE